jgi:molecular chaperone GrpE
MSKDDKQDKQQPKYEPKKDEQLEELEAQIDELTNALQRERADSVNLRRRVEEDRSKMADIYKAQVVRQLLPALDNLERALKHAPKDLKDHDYVKGVQGVVKQFDKVLEEIGVRRIKTEGEQFDPALHEAVSVDEGSEGDIEVVAEELQAGYSLGDEVIRHAMVKVKMEKEQ